MKTVLLAGGLGTRISEESHLRPKPMIEIGGVPILLHIMRHYAKFGLTEFVVCLGYKGYMIKEYFSNYVLHQADVTIDLATKTTTYHRENAEPFTVTLVDTGEMTNTGGRVGRVRDYLPKTEPFCLTYGDGLSNIDIAALIAFHEAEGRLATLTAVTPPGRYGALELDGGGVKRFVEKPPGDNALINGGFFVVEPEVLSRIKADQDSWEADILSALAADGELSAYRHSGFWQPMDTLRDKNYLESLIKDAKAPWI